MIYTIGHSTRRLDEFIALLRAHAVTRLADIRTVPRSRRYPHFSLEALSESLAGAGIDYRHFAVLGGRRTPRPDSPNTAWRHDGFRGYADHLETPAFAAGLAELVEYGRPAPTAIMCAEAVWWRCHRQLLADALVAKGVEVRHIMSAGAAPAHTLTDFAQVTGDCVGYRRLI